MKHIFRFFSLLHRLEVTLVGWRPPLDLFLCFIHFLHRSSGFNPPVHTSLTEVFFVRQVAALSKQCEALQVKLGSQHSLAILRVFNHILNA